jgi:hypothetical protein
VGVRVATVRRTLGRQVIWGKNVKAEEEVEIEERDKRTERRRGGKGERNQ